MTERKKPLRVLHLEDNDLDAELIESTIQSDKGNVQIIRVDTRDKFLSALESEKIDVVLADYSLPTFDGMSALKIVRDRYADLPFILLSGTVGEDIAVEALKAGATDYILKQRLVRLNPALNRAVQEFEAQTKLRRQLNEAEDNYR